MKFLLAAATALALAAPGLSLAEEGRTLITVGGSGGAMEAQPEGAQSLFASSEIDTAGATGFDIAALDALGTVEIDSNLPGQPTVGVTFSGPLISDLLSASGAEGKAAVPTALDGYSVTISWEDLQAHGPILATRADGVPLAIGGIGPSMVIFPASGDAEADKANDGKRVWAVFYVGTE